MLVWVCGCRCGVCWGLGLCVYRLMVIISEELPCHSDLVTVMKKNCFLRLFNKILSFLIYDKHDEYSCRKL